MKKILIYLTLMLFIVNNNYGQVLREKEIATGSTLPTTAAAKIGNKYLYTTATDTTEFTYVSLNKWRADYVKGATTPTAHVTSGTQDLDYTLARWFNTGLSATTGEYTIFKYENEWLSEKPLTARNFGAIGDGTTNDHPAFKMMRDYYATAKDKVVRLEFGKTYLVDPPVTAGILTNSESFYMGDGITLEGNGSNIKLGTTDGVLQYLIVNGSNVAIKNLNLIGNNTTATSEFSAGIALFPIVAGKENVIIENVYIKNFRGDGIYISSNDVVKTMSYKGITIKNVIAESCYRNGLSIIAGENIVIDNFRDSLTGFWGLDIEPDDALEVVKNVTIQNCILSNFATTSVTAIPPIENVTLNNVVFNNALRSGAYTGSIFGNITANYVTNLNIKGVSFRNTGSYGTVDVYNAFRFENAKNVSIENVSIAQSQNPPQGYLIFRGNGLTDTTNFSVKNVSVKTTATGASNLLCFSNGSVWNAENVFVDTCNNFAYSTTVNLKNSDIGCRSAIFDNPYRDLNIENTYLSGTFIVNQGFAGMVVDLKKSTITTSNLNFVNGTNKPSVFADLESNINGHRKQAISNTTIASFDRTFGYSQYSIENTAATGFTLMDYEKSKGRVITFIDGNGTLGTNFLNMFAQSGTINGQASPYRLDKNNGVYEFYSDGTNWQVREMTGIVSQNQQILTAGLTVTAAQSTTDLWINPATNLASEAITLKTSPRVGDLLRVKFGGTIAAGSNVVAGAVTFVGGTTYGDVIPSGINGGSEIHMYYDGAAWKVKYLPYVNVITGTATFNTAIAANTYSAQQTITIAGLTTATGQGKISFSGTANGCIITTPEIQAGQVRFYVFNPTGASITPNITVRFTADSL